MGTTEVEVAGKYYDTAGASAFLAKIDPTGRGIQAETLKKQRMMGRGPVYYRTEGGKIRYLETDLVDYMHGVRVNPREAVKPVKRVRRRTRRKAA